jgi:hypothetical protein
MRIAHLLLAALLLPGCQRRTDPLAESLPIPIRTVPPPATPWQAPVPGPTISPEQVLRVGNGVTEPVELSRVDAIIPENCRTSSYIGLFIFEAVVERDGSVRDVRTLRRGVLAPPCPPLENAYRRAIAQWRYRPATLHDKPVAVYLTVVVRPSHRR